jgi:L-alanine-DL-glutamate epimerase-like enolase superfamily enzyme
MKITHLEAWKLTMPLTEPYVIAYQTITYAENVFLKIQTDFGICGYGCAAPDFDVTNETADTVLESFRRVVEPFLKDEDPFRRIWLTENLKEKLPGQSALLAMVDMALYDLVARRADLPLYKLLGFYRPNIATSITIGILPIEETIAKAIAHQHAGFRIFKLKGGLDVELDIERIRKVREHLGEQAELRFDANQGYSVAEAIYFAESTDRFGVSVFEQPTARYLLDELGEVTLAGPLSVMADESLLNLVDVFRLAKHEWADMVNIKLMKVGGIHQALIINSVARAAGMEAMVGCMEESTLAISAGLAFALARPNVKYADLDGHLDLCDDPTAGAVVLHEGILYPSDLPGLGVEW